MFRVVWVWGLIRALGPQVQLEHAQCVKLSIWGVVQLQMHSRYDCGSAHAHVLSSLSSKCTYDCGLQHLTEADKLVYVLL